MNDLTYPRDARHCSCLGHRAGHPEMHSAHEPDPEFRARNESALGELMASLVGNPFLGGVR